MRLYAAADEAAIRAAAWIRAWTRSGLLTPAQGSAIESGLRPDVKRTNRYLRLALFVFGTIAVWAGAGLCLLILDIRQDWAIGWVAILAGVIDFALAAFLVVRFQLYRFGVEEALAVWSVVFVALGAGFLTSRSGPGSDTPALVACVTAAFASFAAYWLFGFLYAACAAIVAFAATTFYLGLPRFAAHMVSASILLAAFLTARTLRRRHGDDYPGDDYGVIEAVAWIGCYAVLNLRLSLDFMPLFLGSRSDVPPAFYWATYAAIWLMPPIGLALALRDKHRPMIWAGLLVAIGTLLTNKAYLGWEPHTWDPILLGVLLGGSAIAIRRWLIAGAGGHRFGFVAQPLVASVDKDRLGVLSSLAVAAQPFAARTRTETPAFEAGRGGRSGGAGGGADF
jgi:hypothetical protein